MAYKTKEQITPVMQPVTEAIYTLDKVSALLGMEERAVASKLKSGELKGRKKGRRWYVLHSDILNYLNS